jgi:hypothetical protein
MPSPSVRTTLVGYFIGPAEAAWPKTSLRLKR